MSPRTAALVVLLLAGRATAQEPAHAAAARDRGTRYDAVEVAFAVKETFAPGAVSATNPLAPKGKTLPEKETVAASENRLVLHGAKWRYEFNHPLWAPERGTLLATRLVNVYDGHDAKSFYAVGLNRPEVPEGFVHRDATAYDVRTLLLAPLMFHVRGADAGRSPLRAADFKATGTTLRVAGRPCDEFVRTDSKNTVTRVWLDAAAGHVLRKSRRETGGRTDEQNDVTYRQTADGHSVPAGWVRQVFGPDGTVRITAAVEVTRFEVGAAVPAADFAVQFPPTTRVYDARANKTFQVQPDGLMREFDFGTGEQLAAVVDQSGRGWLARNSVYLAGLAVGGGLVGAGIVRRRRRAPAVSLH